MGSSMSTAHSMEHVPDDALGEVLVRVPPHPATLARASLACKGLHRFIGGAEFHHTFQAHHNSTPPPLLGFFHDDQSLPNNFLPIGDLPDRVSTAAFDPKEDHGWRLVDSRHGRVLLNRIARCGDVFQGVEAALIVWDPITDEQWPLPPLLRDQPVRNWTAAVLCATAGAAGLGTCDHLGCCPGDFRVVFVGIDDKEMFASVYVRNRTAEQQRAECKQEVNEQEHKRDLCCWN